MTDNRVTSYLTPEEEARIEEIKAALSHVRPLKRERATILNRARQRRYQALRKAGERG